MIMNRKMVVNVDECSFGRTVKRSYSWLPVGEGGVILADPIVKNLCLILGVTNMGTWFAFAKPGTVESK